MSFINIGLFTTIFQILSLWQKLFLLIYMKQELQLSFLKGTKSLIYFRDWQQRTKDVNSNNDFRDIQYLHWGYLFLHVSSALAIRYIKPHILYKTTIHYTKQAWSLNCYTCKVKTQFSSLAPPRKIRVYVPNSVSEILKLHAYLFWSSQEHSWSPDTASWLYYTFYIRD